MKKRDDFSLRTKQILANRVGWHCSNPTCRKPTSGPVENDEKAMNTGEAAHITAAAPRGARYDKTLTEKQRKSVTNGIWLCPTCAKMVDNDEIRFSVEILKRWKNDAEEAQRRRIEGRKRKRGYSRVPDLQEEMVKVSCPTCGKNVEGCLGKLPTSANNFVCRKCGSFHVHRDPDGVIFTRKPGGTLKGITIICPKCRNQLRVRADKKKFFKNCLDCESVLQSNNGKALLIGPMNAIPAAAFSKKGWQQLLACPNCRGINAATIGENSNHILFARCPKCLTHLKFPNPAMA